jgi:hypothetical protein
MAILENTITSILIILLVVIISSLPLYLAVKLLGGKASILSTFLVMLGTGFISILINLVFPIYGTIIAWLVLIWVFHDVFRLGWLRSIFAWIIWIIFIFVFLFIFSLIGIGGLLF